MPFIIRHDSRFPISCPVSYHAGLADGQGTVWNVSLKGWRLTGNLPLQVGQTCSLTINLPDQQHVFVTAGIVRWVQGIDYGMETLVADDSAQGQIAQYVTLRAQQLITESHFST